jgi:hypothetical protein
VREDREERRVAANGAMVDERMVWLRVRVLVMSKAVGAPVEGVLYSKYSSSSWRPENLNVNLDRRSWNWGSWA